MVSGCAVMSSGLVCWNGLGRCLSGRREGGMGEGKG